MLVSVYLPTRNRVHSLSRAVDSVLGQTYNDNELIVVDDASTDGTQDYLRRMARTDGRLRKAGLIAAVPSYRVFLDQSELNQLATA